MATAASTLEKDRPAGATDQGDPAPTAPAEPAAARPRRPRLPEPAWASRLFGGVAVLAVALAPLVALVRAAVDDSSAPPAQGLAAALVAAARKAWPFDLLLGLPAGSQLREMGPALAYVMGPAVKAESAQPVAGLAIGAAGLSTVVLVAAVFAVWRRLGPLPALWVSALVDLWIVLVGPVVLRDASPGIVVAVPLAALAVLATVALLGLRGAWLWSAVIGSLVAQTRLSAAPLAAGIVLLGGLGAMVAAGDDDRMEIPVRWWRSPVRVLGILALIAIWVPPVIEALRDRPSNLTALWHAFRGHHAHVGWGVAARHAVAASTLLPLGRDGAAAHPTTLDVAIGGAVLGVAVVLVWWLARQRFNRAGRGLVAFAAIGFVLGLWALRRTAGSVTLLGDAWLAWVPLTLALAFGVVLLSPLGPPPEAPVGLKGVWKKLKKKIKERRHTHFVPGRGEHETDRGDRKALAKQQKAAQKKAKKAAAKGKDKAKDKKPGLAFLQWSRAPWWLAVPLAAAALLVAGIAVGRVTTGPAIPVPAASTPAAVSGSPAPGP